MHDHVISCDFGRKAFYNRLLNSMVSASYFCKTIILKLLIAWLINSQKHQLSFDY